MSNKQKLMVTYSGTPHAAQQRFTITVEVKARNGYEASEIARAEFERRFGADILYPVARIDGVKPLKQSRAARYAVQHAGAEEV